METLSEARRLVVKEEEDRGEVTPPSTPNQRQEKGTRSPGAKARSLARLLQFQQRLCREHGLLPSDLQGSRRWEERTPSTSPCSSPRLRQPDARVGMGGSEEPEWGV